MSTHVPQRDHIEMAWNVLRAFLIALGAGTLASLGERQVSILSDLLLHPSREIIARVRGIRRDTFDKKLGMIRIRLGLENHHQLMGAISSLHARNHATLSGDQGKEGAVPLGKESR
jgi:hypothetical protein